MKYLPALIILICSASAIADGMPHGWRLTSPDQYVKEDITWFKGNLPNKVVADFNGDKINDTAWLLTNKSKTKTALFVSLSNQSGEFRTIKLDTNEIKEHIFLGISAQKPGEYYTACGKGYWKCQKNEPAKVKITNTCINYFVFESSSSVYCWSKKQSKFIGIDMSD